jgi:hypothetical protein
VATSTEKYYGLRWRPFVLRRCNRHLLPTIRGATLKIEKQRARLEFINVSPCSLHSASLTREAMRPRTSRIHSRAHPNTRRRVAARGGGWQALPTLALQCRCGATSAATVPLCERCPLQDFNLCEISAVLLPMRLFPSTRSNSSTSASRSSLFKPNSPKAPSASMLGSRLSHI